MADKADNTLYENGIGWAILLVVLAILVWLFWYFFDTEIRDAVRWWRYGEMMVLSHFLDSNYTVAINGKALRWWQGFEITPKFKPAQLRFEHLVYFDALALQPLKELIVGLMAAGGAWCLFLGPQTQFRQHLNLESLIERQAQNFPVIAPFVNFNPSTQPPRPPGSPVPAELPSFAEALGPEEWLAYNDIPIPDGKIDESAAIKAFTKQLGQRWRGVDALRSHEKILLAAFCLKAARKRGDADELLGRAARCWSFKSGLKLSKDSKLMRDVRAVLRNKNIAGKTLAQINRHAFVTTALLRALAFAREEGGVLAPAQFVWLRGYDRRLWYPLNNLGRQSFHMEALGAMSHYKIERMTQRPVPVPKVENAVTTIKEYMGSMRARPIPQLDYSQSKTRGVKKAR